MRNISLIATQPKSGGGGGTDEDPRFPGLELRSHGVVVLVFGLAFGLTAFCAYYILSFTGPSIKSLTIIFKDVVVIQNALKNFFDMSFGNALLFFVSGLVFGTILAGLYNVLIFRRLNLFGIDRTLD